jgi:PAS domain S-box-containing protein
MKTRNSKALDLFLLMINLSQLSAKEKIIDVFSNALGEIWPDIKAQFTTTKSGEDESIFEISSSGSKFGYLIIDNPDELESEDVDLLHNAVSMLSVILKKNEQDQLLADEKLHLQKLVDEKISAIRESEEKFRNVFEQSMVGKSITTLDGNLKINAAFCKILGYTVAELSELKWLDITHPDEIERDQRIINSIISGETASARWEKRYIHKNGNIVWADISTSLQRDKDGKPVYFITSINDITDRRTAEEDLRESERKLKEAQEMAHLGFWSWDVKTGDVEWSEEVFKIFCLDPGKYTPHIDSILALSPWPGDHERDQELINRAIETHTPGSYEQKFLRPDNSVGHYYSTFKGNYNEKGELISLVGTVLDITVRKKSEEALIESENKFRTIFENNSAAMAIIEADTKISMVNEAYCQISGYSKEEVIGMSWTQQIPPEDIDRLTEYNRRRLINPNDAPDKYEFTFYHKNGDIKHALMSVALIQGNRQIVSSFVDITSQKQAEEEVHKLNNILEHRIRERTLQLEESNKELEAFSYSVSHDLRSPLRHISGFVDLLTNRYKESLPEKAIHYLDVISDSTRQMGVLIDDLLQFSRTGRQEIIHTELDMNKILQEALDSLKHETTGRNIKWIISPLPRVVGDYNLLRLVWINLLSNAVKFTRAKKKARIEIGSREESNEHQFCIRDNGAGFDMQYVHKLFGVFQRLHSSEEFEGTGIGLANVRRIIAKHGGRTWAEAELDKGATFYFTLPK